MKFSMVLLDDLELRGQVALRAVNGAALFLRVDQAMENAYRYAQNK